MALLETLTDTFDGTVVDTVKWTAGGSVAPTVSGGTLNFNNVSFGNNSSVISKSQYTVQNSYILTKVSFDTPQAQQRIYFQIDNSTTSEAYYFQIFAGTTLYMTGFKPGGFILTDTNIPYNAVNHAWLRIRHDGTVLYWETSPDAVTWTIRSQATHNPGACNANLYAQSGGSTPAFSVKFDNINVPPPPKLETLTDDFNGSSLDTAKWTWNGVGTHTVSGGNLNLTYTPQYNDCIVTSVDTYTVAESQVFTRMSTTANVTGHNANLEIKSSAGNEDFGLYYRPTVGLVLYGISSAGTSILNKTIATYDAGTMTWWRIRHTGTTMYWETAPDGSVWTVQGQATYTPTQPCRIILASKGGATSTFTSTFDNVNVPPPPPAKMETLTDDFATPTLDSTKWTAETSGAYTVDTTGGTLNFTVAAGQPNTSYGKIYSVGTYSLAESSIMARVYPSAINNNKATLEVRGAGPEYLLIQKRQTFLEIVGISSAGDILQNVGITWDATAMAWFRIRSAGNTVYWETSPNCVTWTIRKQSIYTPTTSLTAHLTASWVATGTTSATTVRFDKVNIAAIDVAPDGINDVETSDNPAGIFTTGKFETFTDDFTTPPLDTVKWTWSGAGDATVSGGNLNLTQTASGTSTLATVSAYAFADSYIHLNIATNAPGNTGTVRFDVYSGSEKFSIYRNHSAGNLSLSANNSAGANITSLNIAWDPVAMAWWRLRHTAGTIYWETSPNGAVWTVQHQFAYALVFASHTMRLYLNLAAAGLLTATVDSINIVPYLATASPASIANAETLGSPDTAFTYAETLTPVGIGDTEAFGDPVAATTVAAAPDGLNDPDTVTGPVSPGLDTLTETFFKFDTAKWAFTAGGPNPGNAWYDIQDKYLRIGAGPQSKGIVSSVAGYGFQESYVYAKVSVPTPTNHWVYMRVVPVTGGTESFYFQFNNNTIQRFVFDSTGTNLLSASTAYNATNHAWWRINRTGASIQFQTSANGASWATLSTLASYTLGASEYRVEFEGYSTLDRGTVAYVDNVNVNPAAPNGITEIESFDPPAITNDTTFPPLTDLTDDFTAPAVDLAKWTPSTVGTAFNITTIGEVLNFTAKTGTNQTHGATVRSVNHYDLANSQLVARVSPITSTGVPYFYMRVRYPYNSEAFWIVKNLSTITFSGTNPGGASIVNTPISYDGTAMAWWRIRHTATIVYWETSPDGIAWTNRAQDTYTPAQGAYYVDFNCTWSGATSAANAWVDNVGLPPVGASPGSITDPQTFGPPTLGAPVDVTANPANITDPEMFDDPTIMETGQAVPDGIANPGTLGDPGLVDGRSTAPDSITDPQTFGDPTADTHPVIDTSPGSAADPETFGPPATSFGDADRAPDSIRDTEALGEPTVPADVPTDITPSGIIDGESFGPPTRPLGPALMELLKDDFNADLLDTTKWVWNGVGYCDTSRDSLYMGITGDPNTTGQVASSTTYIFKNSSVFAKVSAETSTGVSPAKYVYMEAVFGKEIYRWNYSTTVNQINAVVVNHLGSSLLNQAITYNPQTMAWWRIRHTGTIIYFETAPDGVTWTVRAQVTYTPFAALHTFQFRVNKSINAGGIAARFDNINIVPTPVQGDPVADLADDFENGINQSLWTPFVAPAGTTVRAADGLLELYVGDGQQGPWVCGLDSKDRYDLTGSAVFIKAVPSANTNALTGLYLRDPDTGEYVGVHKTLTTLYFVGRNTAGTSLFASSIAYSATAHAWWRIRNSGGTTYIETSPDSITWTSRATSNTPLTGKGFRVCLEGSWATGMSVASYSYIDNVNIDADPNKARPVGITDPATVGTPALYIEGESTLSAEPAELADKETFGDPELTSGGEILVILPDLADKDTLGDPAASTVTPDPIIVVEGLNDPDGFAPPAAVLVDVTEPDDLLELEELGDPEATQPIDCEADPITDGENLDSGTLVQQHTPVTVEDLVDPEIFSTIACDVVLFPVFLNDAIVDDIVFGPPEVTNYKMPSNFGYGSGRYGDGIYSGWEIPVHDQTANYTYGTGTYGYGIYYGLASTENPPGTQVPPMFPDVKDAPAGGQILSIGPWSPGINWRGAPNYGIQPTRLTQGEVDERSIGINTGGPTTTRPAMALPPTTRKGFTLRLNEGSEARFDIAMRRGDAVCIDEMDTDIWWRRRDPKSGRLEMIGRFNCSHADLQASDSGVNQSCQFDDYQTILGARMVLEYKDPVLRLTNWDTGTPVIDILNWALPQNTGIDLSEVRGGRPFNLDKINQPFDIPPGTLISDVFTNLQAVSRIKWEWWVETPDAVGLAPKLVFAIGGRGTDKNVTLFDVGAGPTPIASWARTNSVDDYANTLFFTGGALEGEPGGGVVVQNPGEIGKYGQRDGQDGNTSVGGRKDQIDKAAETKLEQLATRTPTYTIGLTFGFWRGRHHIDVGDTIRLILRLGEEVTDVKLRCTEIQVDIDENNLEDVTLTLGKSLPSTDPRSKRSPLMRILRYLRNYEPPTKGLAKPKT